MPVTHLQRVFSAEDGSPLVATPEKPNELPRSGRETAYGLAFSTAGLAAGAAAFGFQNESSLIHSSET
jgi:hypothetical protein